MCKRIENGTVTIEKVMSGRSAEQVLIDFLEGKIKHLYRYTVVYFNPVSKKQEAINLSRMEFVPLFVRYIKYSRGYSFPKWLYYKEFKDLKCATCQYKSLQSGLEICNVSKNYKIVLDNVIFRHPYCPLTLKDQYLRSHFL